MSDAFSSIMARGRLPLPIEGTRMIRSGGGWEPTESSGFTVVPLLDDSGCGLRTLLMRFEPGCYAALHSHDEVEQIYVIEGEFYDDDMVYGTGDYLVRAAGTPHIAGSREGATVLVVYTRTEQG